MTRTLPALAVAVIAAALAVAGCGSDSSSGGGGAYGSGGETSASQSAKSEAGGAGAGSGGAGVVAVAKNSELGPILANSKGFTLYDFHKDKGTESACYGACAGTWPPLTTSDAPRATNGAQASMLGTTKRKDGTLQVTYAGHPLYTYAADTKPGEANGNDISSFGAEWYTLQPNGEEPED